VVSAMPTINGAPPRRSRPHTQPRVALTMMMNAQVNTSPPPETNLEEDGDNVDAIDATNKIAEDVKGLQTRCVPLVLRFWRGPLLTLSRQTPEVEAVELVPDLTLHVEHESQGQSPSRRRRRRGRKMDGSQSTTQTNNDRDYSTACQHQSSDIIRPSPTTLSQVDEEPRTLLEGETGAVNFGTLSHVYVEAEAEAEAQGEVEMEAEANAETELGPGSQVSEISSPVQVHDNLLRRGAWRGPRASQIDSHNVQGTSPAMPTATKSSIPETPAPPAHPFGTRAPAVFQATQMFQNTQFSSAVKKFSPTSSRPSPNTFHVLTTPSLGLATSPLKGRYSLLANTSPYRPHTASSWHGEQHEGQQEDEEQDGEQNELSSNAAAIEAAGTDEAGEDGQAAEEDVIPESPPSPAMRRPEPLGEYEPVAFSQHRKSSGDGMACDLDSDDSVDEDRLRRLRVKRKREEAERQLNEIHVPRLPDADDSRGGKRRKTNPRSSRKMASRRSNSVTNLVEISVGGDQVQAAIIPDSQPTPQKASDSPNALGEGHDSPPDRLHKQANELRQASIVKAGSRASADRIPETSPAVTAAQIYSSLSLSGDNGMEPHHGTARTRGGGGQRKKSRHRTSTATDSPAPAPRSSARQRRRRATAAAAAAASATAAAVISRPSSSMGATPSVIPATASGDFREDEEATATETSHFKGVGSHPQSMRSSLPVRRGRSRRQHGRDDEHHEQGQQGQPHGRGEANGSSVSVSEASSDMVSGRRPRRPTIATRALSSSSLSALSFTPSRAAETSPMTDQLASPPSGYGEVSRPLAVATKSPPSRNRVSNKATTVVTKGATIDASKARTTRAATASLRRSRLTATRELPQDASSPDQLANTPEFVDTLEDSTMRQSRTAMDSVLEGHTHDGARGLFGGMAFAISFQSLRPGEKQAEYADRTRQSAALAKRISMQGGRVLGSGFNELFDRAQLQPTADVPNNPTALKLNANAERLGFTALIADGHSRKVKYMQALALGVPCLAHQWIKACEDKGAVVDWTPYLLCSGQALSLGNAVRSQILSPYAAADARLACIFDSRAQLLGGNQILLVLKRSSARKEEDKMAYLFLARVLGASLVRTYSIAEARSALQKSTTFDWVYVDENTGTEAELFGLDTKSKKRKRALPGDGEPPAKVRSLSNELIIQTLIMGRVMDEEEWTGLMPY